MKTYSRLLFFPLIALTFSCGQQEELSLEEKKERLSEYKSELSALKEKVGALEEEIAKADTAFAKENRKSVLVTTVGSQNGSFRHFVEVTGSVLSKKNVNISAEVSGRIQEINAVEGMSRQKGQVLAVLDGESIDRNMDELETQLDLARTIYEKQKRLWEREIGTEIQFLEAKNRKESLEKSLASLQTQKEKTTVRAPFDGTVEGVMVRLGELVQPGMPMINFVGKSDLYVEGDVSERYVGVVQKGDSVRVQFPSTGKELKTKVTAVGAVINPDNRTFKVEVFLPSIKEVKPNMIAVLKIKDYESPSAVSVPSNLIQRDNKGDFVYIVENGKSHKKYIDRGRTYGGYTEVTEGLMGQEKLINKGFREVGDGFNVQIVQQ